VKKITVLFICLLTTFAAITQQPNWRNGKYLTPLDDLHILVVFVASDDYRIDDKAVCDMNGDLAWNTASELACVDYYYNGVIPTSPPISNFPVSEIDIIPDWAKDEGFINELKTDINTGLNDDGELPFVNDDQFNISSYYKTMSFGKFNVTGDVVGIVMPQGTISSSHFLSTCCEEDFVDQVFYQLGLDPSKYDNRLNLPTLSGPSGSSNFLDYNATILENVGPSDKDQIIDYVVIIKKARNCASGDCTESAGVVDGSQLDSLQNAVDPNGIPHHLGYYHMHDKTKDSKWSQLGIFIHEFAHNMGIAHNCNANGVVSNKFTATRGWGMIASDIKMFWSATAHSMWLNGWLDENDIHHIDFTDPLVTDDFVEINLTDLLTTPSGVNTHAARIKIPHTNQYLWIENHQKIHPSGFDMENPFPNSNGNEPFDYHSFTEPGIYMYIIEDGHDLNNPPNKNLNANNMLLLHPDGKNDYSLLFNEDSLSIDMVWSNPGIYPEKYNGKIIATADNPIAGSTVREYHRMDNPGRQYPSISKLDGHIYYEPNNNKDSKINEYFGKHWDENTGKLSTDASVERTAFDVNDELSINGIFPILNFRKFNHNKLDSLLIDGQYVKNVNVGQQEPFTLTGLKVEVDSVDASGKYTLTISKDDWEFSSDKRWCDAIILPSDETLTVTNQSNLSLELSGTVNRNTPHPKNRNDPFIKNFVDPTILTAQASSNIIIENNSCINVKEESTLKIEQGATLQLNTGGFIHVKDEDSKLVLDNGATLQMANDSYIEVRDGGTLEINTSNINLANTATKIIIKAGGILTTDEDSGISFDFDGPGKLVIEEGAIIDMPFNLVGEDEDHAGIILTDYFAASGNPNDPCSSPSQPIFKVRNCNFNNIVNVAISASAVYKLYTQNNIFSNAVLGNSNQKAIYGYNNNIESIENVIDNFYTGIYLDGGSNNSTKKLRLSGGEISYCHHGIETYRASTDVKYCAKIHNNFYGIHITATAMKELTVGRNGGASITNNNVAIKGVNIVLDIDAISALNANGGVLHPNNLSGNTWFFDLSYPNTTASAPFGLSARGNYWGSINNCGVGIDAAGMYTVLQWGNCTS